MIVIKSGQVRRFKNAHFDIRYVVLLYTRDVLEKCLVLFLDEHHKGDESVGLICAYDHDTALFRVSEECEL